MIIMSYTQMKIKVITLSSKKSFMTLKHNENPYYNINNFVIEGYHRSFIKHQTGIY